MDQNETKHLIESVMKYARPLEVARLNYLFFEGSKDAIIDELAKYQNEDGGINIIVPADCGLTIEEIAAKDVPAGKAYNIVDVSEIPTDRTFRDAWTWQ